MLRISYIVIPALLLTVVCLDRSAWLRVARSLGPLYKVSGSQDPAPLLPVAATRYEPCLAGCCDADPDFCVLLGGELDQLSDACGYSSVRDRCVKSCNRCFEPEGACEDEWPACSATLEANADFCKLDAGAQFCKRTCRLCSRPACADSLDKKLTCDRAKADLRECAKDDVRGACPQTCGVCAKVPLKELLRHQPCVDEPGCELSDEQVADATMAKFANCEDIGFCKPTKTHPTKEALCADPMFRDTLCRGTCGGCTPQPREKPVFLQPRKSVGPEKCAHWKELKCPKKCGVCRASGSRSVWEVSELDRLVATPQNMRVQK